jgi:hypothetical protein
MRRLRSHMTRCLGLAALPTALLACGVVGGTSALANATLWTFTEVALSLFVTSVVALLSLVTEGPRTQPYLTQLASRGLEVTAALPMVLLCALVAVTLKTALPMVIAITIGVFGGLQCVRIVAASPLTQPGPSRRVRQRALLLLRGMRGLVLPVASTIVEEIVGLEAAIAWIGLFDDRWDGGWGERLGTAARQGHLPALLAWTLLAVALSVGFKRLAWALLNPIDRE